MADVKWIKITTDIFDDEKILLIETMPSADSIIVIWFKLLTLAGKTNNDGVFMMSGRIPFTDEMLASIFRREVNVVRLALKTFEQFGMIEIVNNVVTIPNWNKHQTLDSYEKKKERDRLYQAERRAKQRALTEKSSDNSSDIAFSEEDKEIEKEIEKEEKVDYQKILGLYHSICKSYPSVRSLSEARKKAIKARLNTYSVEDFKTVFENAESSAFLKGKNNRNWSANFDWLIADKNFVKVLEGAYADRGKKEIVPGWMDKRELDGDEIAAINAMMGADLADRAEQLKQRLQG